MLEIRLPIRYYECDAYGHLNNVSYVRYIEEAIFQSDDARDVAVAGSRQRILSLEIEYLRPARYGESVELQMTWARETDDVPTRTFVFRTHDSADPLATAKVEMVAPAPSDSVVDAAKDRAMREIGPLPEPPDGVYIMHRRVSWQDLDLTGRVSEAIMLGFAEECGMRVITAHGWPPEQMVAAGFAIILRHHKAVFATPAQLNDDLEVATWVSQVRRISAMRHYTIRRAVDGLLLARVDTLGVWVDVATGRPIRVPAQFSDDFAPNVSAG